MAWPSTITGICSERPPWAAIVKPGITVVAQDPPAIGRLAAERLFARLGGDNSPPAVHTIPTRLVIRGSGELPADLTR